MDKMKLDPDGLYLGDNGRMLCGKCSGCSAQYTGRDISGQKVLRVTTTIVEQEFGAFDLKAACESCNREHGVTLQ